MKPTIDPTVKQQRAWFKLLDTVTYFVTFGGGAGGGKSWLGCEWLLTRCYEFPGTKWFIGRQELKRLMASTYITMGKVFAFHKIPFSDWKLNGQYNYIEFKNGSRIDLLDCKYQPSDPDFERFGSVEYTGGWLEEASEINFGAFDVLKTRVGRHLNKEYSLTPKLLMTCNPKKNWLYSVIYKPWKENRLPAQYAFLQSLYRDNPFTADDYGKMLSEITDPAKRARLKDGLWEYDDNPAKMIDYNAIVELFLNKMKPSEEKFLTIDVARKGKDRAVIGRWEGLQCKEILAFNKTSLATDGLLMNAARDLCNKHFISRSNCIADEDGVGGGFVDNFRCKGFMNNSSPIQPLAAEWDKTKKVNYDNLKTQCTFMLADLVNARKLGVDETEYVELIKEELEQIQRNDIDSEGKITLVPKKIIKENLGRSPDFSDMMMMRMYFEINKTEEFVGSPVKIEYDNFGRPKISSK